MTDKTDIGYLESLLRYDKRVTLDATPAKPNVLGGVGAVFGSDPFVPIVPSVPSGGLVCWPHSISPWNDGWGFPYTSQNLPLGTPNGAYPLGIMKKDESTGELIYERSDKWFPVLHPDVSPIPPSYQYVLHTRGRDWQSSTGQITISYGARPTSSLSRYTNITSHPVDIRIKDKLISLNPPITSDLASVAAKGATLYVATLNNNSLKIHAYEMQDSSVQTQAVDTVGQEIFDYQYDNLKDEDFPPEDPFYRNYGGSSGVTISPRSYWRGQMIFVFSPNAQKGVLTTKYGDLVEFAISGNNVTVVEEHKIRRPQDDFFVEGIDVTDGFSSDTVTSVDAQESSSTSPGAGCGSFWHPEATTHTKELCCNYTSETTASGADSANKAAYKKIYLISDFDQITNERIDLYLQPRGSKTRSVHQFTESHIQHWKSVSWKTGGPGPWCQQPEPPDLECEDYNNLPNPVTLCPDNPQPFGSTSTPKIGTFGAVDVDLYLGDTLLKTFGGHTTTHSENGYNAISDRLKTVIAADLRMGYIAYEWVEEELNRSDPSIPLATAPMIFDQTVHFEVVGGKLLPSASISETVSSKNVTYNDCTNANEWPGIEICWNSWRGFSDVFWSLPYPVCHIRSRLGGKIFQGHAISSENESANNAHFLTRDLKPLSFLHPDVALANFTMESQSQVTAEYTYNEFSHGIAVDFVEAVGNDREVIPRGVI